MPELDITNVAEVYRALVRRYPDWKPEPNTDENDFSVTFRWPWPLKREGTPTDEVFQSILEWLSMLWKENHLDQKQWGEEGSFFHTWGYSVEGLLTLKLSSPMTEAISDAMGRATYYILPSKDFSITFNTNNR